MKDYHVHSGFLNHTKDNLESIIAAADSAGFEEIAITEHLIWSAILNPKKGEDTLVIEKSQIPGDGRKTTDIQTYLDEIGRLASKYRVRVLKGLEVDYYQEHEDEIRSILKRFDINIVLGSCHYICDNRLPAEERYIHVGLNQRVSSFIEEFGIEKLYEGYFNNIEMAVRSGLFDYMAHIDFIKKAVPAYSHEVVIAHIRRIFEIMIKMNVGLEINLKGVSKSKEPSPSHPIIEEYKRMGGEKISIGSDAHSVEQLVSTKPFIGLYEQKYI
jgi:histidinol-phosphatase (PHP family)